MVTKRDPAAAYRGVAIEAARKRARELDRRQKAYWQKHRGVFLPWFALQRRSAEAWLRLEELLTDEDRRRRGLRPRKV